MDALTPVRQAEEAHGQRSRLFPNRYPCLSCKPSDPSISNHPWPSRLPRLGLALGHHRVIRQASSPGRHSSREVIGVTWASPFPSRLAKATGRIEFTCVTDGSFASGCFPPRLVATQLPSATRNQTFLDEDSHLADTTTSQAHRHGPFRLKDGLIRGTTGIANSAT